MSDQGTLRMINRLINREAKLAAAMRRIFGQKEMDDIQDVRNGLSRAGYLLEDISVISNSLQMGGTQGTYLRHQIETIDEIVSNLDNLIHECKRTDCSRKLGDTALENIRKNLDLIWLKSNWNKP